MYHTIFIFFILTIIILPVYAESDKDLHYTIKVTAHILEPQYQSETVKVYSRILASPYPLIREPINPIITPTETPSISDTSSNENNIGGSGRTGVGPESSSGPVLSRGGNSENVIPKWVGTVVLWWNNDMVTEQEFKSVITYLLDENIIPNNTVKPDSILSDLVPSVQHIFVLWADNKLADSSIMGLINYYRSLGVW